MKNPFRSLTLSAALLMTLTCALQADPALLANKALANQKLDADAAKAVLLGKRATLGGTRVVLVIAKKSQDQESFLKQHVGMTTSQFQTYWRRLYMTGGGSAPKVVATEAEACQLAAKTPGAVTIGDSTKAAAEGLAVLTDK